MKSGLITHALASQSRHLEMQAQTGVPGQDPYGLPRRARWSKAQAGSLLLEVCVEDAAGLEAAVLGGADRIELCSALSLGGLTPSFGLMQLAVQAPCPVHVLIRPRMGDFHYSAREVEVMVQDITSLRALGLAGAVIGAATLQGDLDLAVLSRLVAACDGLDLTLNRVFDLVPDQAVALEQAVSLGFDRVLTSGAALHAERGLVRIRQLAAQADGRIVLMPGSGVGPDNAALFLAIPGICELHASCRSPGIIDPQLVAFGFSSGIWPRTDAAQVQLLKSSMLAAAGLA